MSEPIFWDPNVLMKKVNHLRDSPGEYLYEIVDLQGVLYYYFQHPDLLSQTSQNYREAYIEAFKTFRGITGINTPVIYQSIPYSMLRELSPYIFTTLPHDSYYVNYINTLLEAFQNIDQPETKELFFQYLIPYIVSVAPYLLQNNNNYDNIITLMKLSLNYPSIKDLLRNYFPSQYESFYNPHRFLEIPIEDQKIIMKVYLNNMDIFMKTTPEYQNALINKMIEIKYSPRNEMSPMLPVSSEVISFIVNRILPLTPITEEDFIRRLIYIMNFFPFALNYEQEKILFSRIYLFLNIHSPYWINRPKLYKTILDKLLEYIEILPQLRHNFAEMFPQEYQEYLRKKGREMNESKRTYEAAQEEQPHKKPFITSFYNFY